MLASADISYMLRDISTSIYTPKCCSRGRCLPFPLATPLSSRQNHKFASSYVYSQIYWSRTKLQKLSYWRIFQNKNRSCTCSEMLNLTRKVFHLWLHYRLVDRELSRNFVVDRSRRQADHPFTIQLQVKCHATGVIPTPFDIAAKCWTQRHIFPSIQFSHTQLYQ